MPIDQLKVSEIPVVLQLFHILCYFQICHLNIYATINHFFPACLKSNIFQHLYVTHPGKHLSLVLDTMSSISLLLSFKRVDGFYFYVFIEI